MVLFLLSSCAEKKQSEGCCTFTDLSRTAPAGSGEGRLQIAGSTAAYYHVFNEEAEELSRRRLNESIDLPSGRYLVTVNHSSHYVEIEPGRLSRCATGTLMVSGHTQDPYAVADSTSRHLVDALLGEPVSLFPGTYRVSINNTDAHVTVRRTELTTARTGLLSVRGSTNELYHVLDHVNEQLAYAGLGKSIALFPGTYVVKVNNTSMKANVLAGRRADLGTGTILVKGLTDEYYYVTDSAANALNYQSLNKPLAFFPGHYYVNVNNTVLDGGVTAGDTTVFATGSLVFNGPGASYYYVLDEAGEQLAYTTLNRPLSFFPARYTLQLGTSVRQVDVTPGALEVVRSLE